jgi:2'-5' RNA ligase
MRKRRLFTAVIPEAECLRELQATVAELTATLPSNFLAQARFTPRENWHFTLTFLGYQEEGALPAIAAALRSSTARAWPFSIRFRALAYSTPPRMIWATLEEESSRMLGTLQGASEQALREHGVVWRAETRPYTGHLTIARFAYRGPLPHIDRSLAPLSGKIDALELMESHLSSRGATYEILQTMSLRSSPAHSERDS